MGGSGTLNVVLKLIPVCMVCLPVISATANTTQGPGFTKSGVGNAVQEPCQGESPRNATPQISAAVFALTGQLYCRSRNNSLSVNESKEVEENLKRIIASTLKVILDLQGSNGSGSGILDMFEVLDDLKHIDLSDHVFIRLWFSTKMVPLLPFVDDVFWVRLSSQNFSCRSFQEIISILSSHNLISLTKRQSIFDNFILKFLSRSNVADPGCTKNIEGSGEWLRKNFGKFVVYATIRDLIGINGNFIAEKVLDQLTVKQKAELLLDDQSSRKNVTDIFEMLTSDSTKAMEELTHFFESFSSNANERNITYVTNSEIRDIMLNLTLKVLAPNFQDFETEDYGRWFHDFLIYLIPSFKREQLELIPANISCDSYAVIVSAFEKTLSFVPVTLASNVKANIEALKDRYPRCSVPASFVCQETNVTEDILCSGVNRPKLGETLSTNASLETICNYTLIEHACSMATNITASNLVKILKCSKNGPTEPIQVWKILFQKASPVLAAALETFSTMVGNMSFPSLSTALDAVGELQIATFNSTQLQNETFIQNWFQNKIRPLLASPSRNFLYCLSSRNFSCSSYHSIIRVFSSQKTSMDRDAAPAVFSHLIKPFLSRSNRSDPACRSSSLDSERWVQDNLGSFLEFATVQELQGLNPEISTEETLGALTPTQIGQLALSSGALNDTRKLEKIFDQLEDGDALENSDLFLTEVQAGLGGTPPILTPDARDLFMNRTFGMISPSFQTFNERDWAYWFLVRLRFLLPSFRARMLRTAILHLNCTNYRIVVRALSRAYPYMSLENQRQLKVVMLVYLENPANMINKPECNIGIDTDAKWLEKNLGRFQERCTYSELRVFNLSQVAIAGSLTPDQQAQLLLDPVNGALEDETIVRTVFESFANSSDVVELTQFFDVFSNISKQDNRTSIDPHIRDIIFNLTLTELGPKLTLLNVDEVKLWFQVYLPLFLPSIDVNTFEIIPLSISCNSYQQIVKGCNNVFSQLSELQTIYVFTFTRRYLSKHASSGASCVDSNNDDRIWLENNFAQFSTHASFSELRTLKTDFEGVNVADLLTFRQLVEVAATPGQLQTREDVVKVMTFIRREDLGSFYDGVSPIIQMNQANYTVAVTSALLETALDKAQLSSPSVSDEEVMFWFKYRLDSLFKNISSNLVTPLFHSVTNRACNVSQHMITLLDNEQLTLSKSTKEEIYRNIFIFLQGPMPIRCYERGSFYTFLRNTFLSFGFPDLSMFLSLMPKDRERELLNTISTSELSQLFSQPNVTANSDICYIYNNYNKTQEFLENEEVPEDLKSETLACLWPTALSSSTRSEATQWFRILRQCLPFLTKSLISPSQLQNSSCFGFQEFVSIMGNNFTYNISEFGRVEVYDYMTTYLSTGSGVRCFNASDPQLNSTSWFVLYIGSFITFVTVDDLDSFIPPNEGSSFFEDPANLKLLNSTGVSDDIIDYYISELFVFNPTYSIVRLPGPLLCSFEIPSSAFETLTEAETLQILNLRDLFCGEIEDLEVNAALASNFEAFTVQIFTDLGSASNGLSPGQISAISPEVLISSLPTLSTVNWNQEQASASIQIMQASGFQLSTGSSLSSVGTLIAGISSETINAVPSSELLSVSQDATFVNNMFTASTVVQEVFVEKIISLDQSPSSVVQNVPDKLAPNIPFFQLMFTEATLDINVVNQKTWKHGQAVMFFESVSTADFDPELLSSDVLQGFTCTTVRRSSKSTIQKLVRACRPRIGRAKVNLKEHQLTCMYNLLNGSLSQNFTEYPPDMLLYLSPKDVERNNCRSYISAVGAADFSVSSAILNKGEEMFREARTCLGISGFNLSREVVAVLGNTSCALNSSYLQNSDPSIVETIKSCKELSGSQVAAIETLLLSGKTSYGNVSTWNQTTLQNLGSLPLYLTNSIWSRIKFATRKRFLKRFMPGVRKSNIDKTKLKTFFTQISLHRVKRGAGCTVGNITSVTVGDASFPFGYDQTQFDLCLDLPVLKENLNSICDKVDDDSFQTVILRKLNEAYPAGVSDEKVRVLGSVSRSASLDDIAKWNITKIDTLSALMKSEDGAWEAAKSKAIISKYLDTPGTSLGTNELNAIGSNICALDTAVLQNITAASLRNANPPNLESCSDEQKAVLYQISKTSFSSQRNESTVYYNLINNYLCGAPLKDIRALSTQNINMDISTFQSLNTDVINNLTVGEVRNLLGNHVSALKTFEESPVISNWTNLQSQEALNTLGIGLRTTRVDTTISPSVTNTAATATSRSASKASSATTTTATSASGSSISDSTSNGVTTTTVNPTTTTSNTTSKSAVPVSLTLSLLVLVLLINVIQLNMV